MSQSVCGKCERRVNLKARICGSYGEKELSCVKAAVTGGDAIRLSAPCGEKASTRTLGQIDRLRSAVLDDLDLSTPEASKVPGFLHRGCVVGRISHCALDNGKC